MAVRVDVAVIGAGAFGLSVALHCALRASYYHPAGDELAVWCPEDAYIEEPSSLIDAYLAAGRRHGVELFENEPAVAVLAASGRVTGLDTTARRIDADVVVDAAGAWVRQVAELARGPFPRCKVPVAPYRHQLMITEPSPEARETDAVVRVLDAATYLRPARGGLMADVFESDPLPLDPRLQPESFDTGDVPLDLSVLRKAAGTFAGQVPLASQAPVAEHRAGLITMTPDGCFVAGPVEKVPGLWVVSGCNCSGFSLSPAIGEALADWITAGHSTSRIGPFAPSRFDPVTDEHLISRGAWEYAHFYDPADA